MDWIMKPWPWWISGALIGLTVPLLYILAGKAFGISTSLQQVGAMCMPHSRHEYLSQHNRRQHMWTVIFVLGIAVGSFVATRWLSDPRLPFLPEMFNSTGGSVKLLAGGFLVGFGTRYAGGCTSGHSITGISNLNVPSMIATVCFFAGGLFVTWVLGPLLF